MRIKRFVAPDMRAALRMVRDEHGPDAVILSNRPVHGGIEVVAATDYDEALVQQALRTAAESDAMIVVPRSPISAAPSTPQVRSRLLDEGLTAPTLSRADAMIAALGGGSTQAREQRTALAERARGATTSDARPAIASLLRKPAAAAATPIPATANRSDDFRALLARLNASEEPASLFAPKTTPASADNDEATAQVANAIATPATAERAAAEFDVAPPAAEHVDDVAPIALAPGYTDTAETRFQVEPSQIATAEAVATEAFDTLQATTTVTDDSALEAPALVGEIELVTAETQRIIATTNADPDAANATEQGLHPNPEIDTAGSAAIAAATAPTFADSVEAPVATLAAHATNSIDAFDALAEMAAVQAPAPVVAVAATVSPVLQIVGASEDPGLVAMRSELASMRQMIERQMGQFGLERLRGSPARALAFETLQAYGCDDALAQAIASRIDPQLEPARVKAPLLAELARMLTIARAEPLEDGGVFALIGPTGAGKTTTIAKLAARYAQRHRARDVALVTTDIERPGAREQLHALGRKLGVTVCEAQGPEGLSETLDQLVDYPLVLVDTAGYAARDRALLGQVTWLRATRRLRSLLVLPANLQPQDLSEAVRRYRIAAPEAVVLTKLDETGRLGGALSVAIKHGLSLAYTSAGQQVPADLEAADASRLVLQLEKLRRASENPLATEERHVVA